jgi:T-complex protein 1 subunit gamma
MQQPVIVLNNTTKRDTGRKAQLSNIEAARAIGSIVRTTLGPKSMLKMLLDPMGGIVLTNDGHAILREVDVTHPAAKSMLELSRAQDEEVGDGTTSVIILASELLSVTEPLLSRKDIHPTTIVSAYMQALEDAEEILLSEIAIPIAESELAQVVRSSIDTKFASRFTSELSIANLALQAAQIVKTVHPASGQTEIDMKRYARVEKLPGGALSDCCVLDGVMFNKDVTHGRMRRLIRNPRVVLLDCPLEYKKGESMTNVELTKEADFAAILRQEEEEVRAMCADIIAVKPDLVITEKGVSDLAQHFLMKHNISVVRRIRKTDNNRVARVTGATIANRCEELSENHVGTDCGLFKIEKIGEEYFCYLVESKNPKACTVLLRGASKDVLNEIERNLIDAFNVARNILLEPKLLPGGGACEMALARRLAEKAKSIEGVKQICYKAVAQGLEVIPRTLAQNAGMDVVRTMTELRSAHAAGIKTRGIDGNCGKVVDVIEAGIWDSYAVKVQVFRAAIESAAMILRIDDIVSGLSGKKNGGGPSAEEQEDRGNDEETFGDSRDG